MPNSTKRAKSAFDKHNVRTTRDTTKSTVPPLEAKKNLNSNTTTTNTRTTTSSKFETLLSPSLRRGPPKSNEQTKAKLSSSTTTATKDQAKALTTAITASTTSSTAHSPTSSSCLAITKTTTTTTLLPQTNLLKIEPFVPSLIKRPQKIIRRSYSTLSNTTLKKLHTQNVNKNFVHQLEIQQNNKATLPVEKVLETNKSVNSVQNGLPKSLRQSAILHRRTALRGPINRQRSRSTSSSNSNLNPNHLKIANVAISATPLHETPCASPNSVLVIQQSNGICRIQRNAKEKEKLPDRINYDKRGLTTIPMFENETNLRLLSLQHNLINTFHIPKEQECKPEEDVQEIEQQVAAETETNSRQQKFNGNSCRNVEQNFLENETHKQTHQHCYNYKQRLPLSVAKPNVEQLQPQVVPGHLMLKSNAATIKNPVTFGSCMLQRNKLLHSSININNCQMTNHKGNLQHPAQFRFSMRKSKSFVSNLNLQLNVTKHFIENQKTTLLKRSKELGNLRSFDSSASTITTDSTQSTLLTTEVDDSLIGDGEEEDKRSNLNSPLTIKSKQFITSYGNVFENLVFLDLYDNQIERISNLDGLTALTVLLLGKNRISDITGLSSLKSTLRVLDLHGNKLCSISNKINCLKELKSLNLAGNQIRQINPNDFMGLNNLKELNLKRNRLKHINGFQHLVALERLWLCHNELHKVDDMSSIAKAQNLIEITIENNPLTLAGDCVSFLVSYLPKLQTLSQMLITEQVRKAAMTWRTNKELSNNANCNLSNREVLNIIRREEIISNARTNWELLRSQQMMPNSMKHRKVANSSNSELEKINETNENNFEEFIKLPPIEFQQQVTETNKNETEERSSSASSLGPNVNSLSSCYSSPDEDDTRVKHKSHKLPNNINKPSSSSSSSLKSKEQMENIINHASSTDNNHLHQHQHHYFHSLSKCNNTATTEIITPITSTASNCASTLKLEFPMETNKVSANQQNQTVTSTTTTITTTTSVLSSISSMQTVTTTTLSSSTANIAPASVTLPTKRYMTGSLIRSQTIVGTVTGAGGVAIGVCGNSGGYINGYTIKTNNVTTANNIRYQSKLNPNATTQTAAITTLQQTITTNATITTKITPMTMITTTPTMPISDYTIAAAIANNNANNGLIASSMDGNNISLTLNTSKTLVTAASNNITAQTTTTITALTAAATGSCGATSTKLTPIEREREQGGDYLIEICGRYLNIYGQGALRFIDKQWNPTKANDVHTFNFSYINFNNIAAILGRIKVRFVHAENFVFRETNINCLGQLNALAELQGINSLNIDDEGNPITNKDLWRQYAIYRLSHWGLKMLNNIEVTAQDIEKSNAIFAGLSDLILWSMPDAMLQPLLARLRLDETCAASKLLPKQWLQKPDNKSLRLVVGKEALQWKKPTHPECLQLPTPQQVHHLQNVYYNGETLNTNFNQTLASSSAALTSPNVTLTTRERGKIHFTLMMENTCNAVEKLQKLEQIWPIMLQNIVRNTLLDYSQLDAYIRNLMAEIMK